MISSMITSSSSATVRVEKATSEFLMGPDWTINIDICDTINTNQMLAKDVVKAVKKRLQHKNPNVQLLALTLLETMVKNCGDCVHFQIAEKNILQDMVKIVKKRTDMRVRDKVLVLIGSWYEAFGGSQGRYPQYFMAYEDLRRSGVQFPKSSPDAAPIFTPPVTIPISNHPQPGYGMPSSSSTRLDEAMAADDNFSLSNINSMRDVLDLLNDMLLAVGPSDPSGVKDEVIVDLVGQCRSNQKKLMDVLATSGDEELLGQGLEFNDDLQSVLARHDAIASGSPVPPVSPRPVPNGKPAGGSEKLNSSPESANVTVVPSEAASNVNKPSIEVAPVHSSVDEEEEEEDDFSLLARRHSKPSVDASPRNGLVSPEAASSPITSNALVPVTSAPAQSKDQDIIDLLSLTLSTTFSTEQTPASPMHNNSQPQQDHVPPSTHPGGVTYSSETSYPINPNPVFNSYVAPWAQPQQQPQPQPQPQVYSHSTHHVNVPQFTSQPQMAQHQSASQFQPQRQFQPEQQHLGQYQSPYVNQPVSQPPQQQYSAYPPPPWASTPGYYSNPNPVSRPPQTYSMASGPSLQSMSRPLQHESNNGHGQVNFSSPAPSAGQKPSFIPSYRLFEDIDVFGANNTGGRFKASGNASNSLSGAANQSMVGGRK